MRGKQALSEKQVRLLWSKADCVCFDVDSTVCKTEAIDEIADFLGCGEQVQKMTCDAMSGNLSFREALEKRLNIIRPSLKNLKDFNNLNKSNKLTPGIKELVELLHKRKVHVYLVSGGFKITINQVADMLKIEHKNIFANEILFDENGEYRGFCKEQPTSESGGKPAVMKILREKFNYKTIVMVGDGMTDLESCPPADAFIGFGGNVIREAVKLQSSWFVTSFQHLINELSSSRSKSTSPIMHETKKTTEVC